MKLIAGFSSTLVSRYKPHTTMLVLVVDLLALSTSIVPLAQAQTPPGVSVQTYWPANEWRSSSPEAQGMDSAVLARALDYVAQHKTPIPQFAYHPQRIRGARREFLSLPGRAIARRSVHDQKHYDDTDRHLGLKSFSLAFSNANETVVHFEFADGRLESRPVGLDGVPRVTPDGRFHLPVALTGTWESDQTFVLDYDEVANINSYRFRLAFSDGGVSVELNERTGLVKAKFNGAPGVDSRRRMRGSLRHCSLR